MRYFGTDGVRGEADWILKNRIACKLGEAIAEKGGKVIIARDVRTHSFDIEKQLVEGLLTGEVGIGLCGILPTPALAYTADCENADYAVMITASHNAPEYNGLKLFGKNGRKLSPCEEKYFDDALAAKLDEGADGKKSSAVLYDSRNNINLKRALLQNIAMQDSAEQEIAYSAMQGTEQVGEKPEKADAKDESTKNSLIGLNNFYDLKEIDDNYLFSAKDDEGIASRIPDRITILEGAERNYKRRVLSMFPRFEGIKVRLDLAHGCFAELAADIFTDLGAEVVAVNDVRDGEKVNVACGSTHITRFEVKKNEIGFAFDGDGDRVLAVVDGKVYDGDAILLALSMLYRLRGKLRNRFVVGTLLTNSRLQRELAWQGTVLLRADVGDKNVLNMLAERDCPLGGEKSGHIIMADKASTGDGLLTALTLLEAKKTMGRLPKFSPYPMREYNIRAENPAEAVKENSFVEKTARAEEVVGIKGRIIVRPSGTEPYIRVAVEYYAKNHGDIFTRIQNIFGL